MPSNTPTLTQDRLKYLMTYDPDTGHFTRNVTLRGRFARAGTIAGGFDSLGYAHIIIDKKRHKVHRLAFLYMLGELPPESVDHINGNPSDNRWCNLRPANHFENMANTKTRSHNKLGVMNVRKARRSGKFEVRITCRGERRHYGTFESLEEASAFAKARRKELFGEFAGSGRDA